MGFGETVNKKINTVVVAGLWHLGVVTAACLASSGYQVIGYDANQEVVRNLKKGKAPLYEPGLEDLLEQHRKNLTFSSDLSSASQGDLLWITYDTPVDDQDRADVDAVVKSVKELLPHCSPGALVLISSQLPVGSTGKIEKGYRDQYPEKPLSFGYSPENLRLGKAIEVFKNPERVVVGVQTPEDRNRLEPLFGTYTATIEWMSVESAELAKHALNAFLATSITFINEVAALAEKTGANIQEVERALKSDARIGPRAYLKAGGPFAGGTLARDISYLSDLGREQNLEIPLLSSVQKSNNAHKEWPRRRLLGLLGSLENKTIAVLGLTYKAGTDTLRRSSSVETCLWLKEQGASLSAYDPAIKELPENLSSVIRLCSSPSEAFEEADGLIIATEWTDFKSLSAEEILSKMKNPLVLDAGGFLEDTLGKNSKIAYYAVGRSQ